MSASRLAELIRAADSVVALTGAGISVPSGIPDFRSPGTGLWENVDPMAVAHIDAFRRDPGRFWAFYGQRFASPPRSAPLSSPTLVTKNDIVACCACAVYVPCASAGAATTDQAPALAVAVSVSRGVPVAVLPL